MLLAAALPQSAAAAPAARVDPGDAPERAAAAPALAAAPGLHGPALALWLGTETATATGPAAAQRGRRAGSPPSAPVWWAGQEAPDQTGRPDQRSHGRRGPAAAAEGSQAPGTTAAPAAPLGSLWKLFVYVYLDAQPAEAGREPPYRCQAGEQRLPEDSYCCEPGRAIGRDEALVKSCGPYFEPQRLGLSATAWHAWWQVRQAPAWLRALDQLQPEQRLAVADILAALAAVPATQRERAGRALLPLSLGDDDLLARLGSGWRFKTWSSTVDGLRRGGAAGWLGDGRPFWFGAPGTSRSALQAQGAWLQAALRSAPAAPLATSATAAVPPGAGSDVPPAGTCVDVAYFNRYPIERVSDAQGRTLAAGPLPRRLRIEFSQGTRLDLAQAEGLWLQQEGEAWQVNARLTVEDYVARVVDREGQASAPAAARALAVAARSYLLQNARPGGDCLAITDDSRQQRVSPQRASAAARQAAADTRDLVLNGQAVHYRLADPAPGMLAWQRAVEADRAGLDFVAILREAFPAARFAPWGQAPRCDPWPAALDWLRSREARWQRALREARLADGFEAPGPALQVCRLAAGPAHADPVRLEIHVRDWQSLDGRAALIHEFLHLAYRAHPRGADEALIETWAQRLAQQ